jgi:hypothetical protein
VFGSIGAAARFLASGKANGTLAPHRLLRMVNEARRHVGTQTMLPWMLPQPPLGSELRSR